MAIHFDKKSVQVGGFDWGLQVTSRKKPRFRRNCLCFSGLIIDDEVVVAAAGLVLVSAVAAVWLTNKPTDQQTKTRVAYFPPSFFFFFFFPYRSALLVPISDFYVPINKEHFGTIQSVGTVQNGRCRRCLDKKNAALPGQVSSGNRRKGPSLVDRPRSNRSRSPGGGPSWKHLGKASSGLY